MLFQDITYQIVCLIKDLLHLCLILLLSWILHNEIPPLRYQLICLITPMVPQTPLTQQHPGSQQLLSILHHLTLLLHHYLFADLLVLRLLLLG